jgi:Putative zincin peptidase
MRFIWGSVPPSRVFDPLQPGWTTIPPLAPKRFATLALLLGLPFCILMAFLLVERKDGLRGLFRDDLIPAIVFLVSIPLAIVIHELIHVLAYGQSLRSPHLIVGFCPRVKCPYVFFDGALQREALIRMLIAPFLLLSLLPLVGVPLIHGSAKQLVLAFCAIHTAMCGGDVVVIWRLAKFIPRHAIVQIHTGLVYWRAS